MKKMYSKKNVACSKLGPNGKGEGKKQNQTKPQLQSKEIKNNILEKENEKSQIQSTLKQPISLENTDLQSRKFPLFSQEETRITEQQSNFDSNEAIQKNQKINAELAHHIQDIWDYVIQRSNKYQIDPNYLRNQKRINQRSRNNLVRQLFTIYNTFSLQRTTLYLAVYYMDLYFSKVNNLKDIPQVVGIAQACMLIAMKYQQIYPPQLSQWMNNRFMFQVIEYEAKVLKALDYQVSHYTLQHFFHFIVWKQSKCGQKASEIQLKALFLMDLSLFELSMSEFKMVELARCLYYYSQNRLSQCDKNIFVNIKWMIQKNADSIEWLSNHNYRGIDLKFLC